MLNDIPRTCSYLLQHNYQVNELMMNKIAYKIGTNVS